MMTASPDDHRDAQLISTNNHQSHQSALDLHQSFSTYAETFPPLRKALSTLQSAFRLYTPANLAVAFNGGKDATVVMHLARAAVAHWSSLTNTPASLHCLYLLGKPGSQFPEIDQFVSDQISQLNLVGSQVQLGIKDGIEQFISERDSVCAFVMGTRRTDPHAEHMEHFDPSSPSWPPFMRVNPILSWRYADVWTFLKHFNLPYCELYDRGYTSIGSLYTTNPNPALKYHPRDPDTRYKPAWMLEDETLERAGREKKSKS